MVNTELVVQILGESFLPPDFSISLPKKPKKVQQGFFYWFYCLLRLFSVLFREQVN